MTMSAGRTIGDVIVIVLGAVISLCVFGVIFHLLCGEDEEPQLSDQDHATLEQEQYAV